MMKFIVNKELAYKSYLVTQSEFETQFLNTLNFFPSTE